MAGKKNDPVPVNASPFGAFDNAVYNLTRDVADVPLRVAADVAEGAVTAAATVAVVAVGAVVFGLFELFDC